MYLNSFNEIKDIRKLFQTLWSILTRRVHFLSLFQELWPGPNIGIRARLQWQPTKRGLKPWRLDSVALSEILLSTRESSNNHNNGREGFFWPHREKNDGGRQMFSSKMEKLEFPKYSGANPIEWFYRAAQFFEFQGTADNQKVSLASFHLEGKADQWWQWLRRAYQEEDRLCEDFDEALSKVRQIGSLCDYQKEFERLGNQVHGWSQKALIGSFMGGLRSEISETICMFKPKTLKEATSLARMKDEQLQCQRRISRPLLPVRTPLALPPTTQASTVKRLPWEEMQRRRAQGLCFNCDDKFTSGHICKGPQLILLEGNIDDELEGDTKKVETNIPSDPKISLHALIEWTAAKTMRVTAKIGTHDVVVLIDSGSTHNFISDKVAALLHLPVVPTAPFHVRVANGQPLKCQGRFDNIHILLQGIPFSITFYSLPLTRSSAQILQQASLEAISKDIRHTSSIFAIYLQPTATLYQTIQPDMQTLIEAFTAIFQEPQQLPPVREIEHCIPLKEGTEPTNVCPYRYAYFQKAKIEKQVLDMLQLGLIRPSTSPFSSLVLLVKKKDDTWHFCTDYRALNSITIKDRFPIPTVDDMLDELHGASYFTKLDLRAGYYQV
ncbi:hypothetical protein UlMin_012318 [Ulmus minor]